MTIKNKYINNFRNKIDFSLIHWVDERNQTSKINEMKKIQKINNIKIKNIIPLSKKDKYITGKSPSSGFAVLLYYLRKYPESNIFLMGFTFNNGINNWHNYSNEIKFINNYMFKSRRIKIFN